MIINRIKIKKAIKKLVIIICVCVILYFALNIIDKMILPTNNDKKLTAEERREKIYNTPVFGDEEIKEEEIPNLLKIIDDYYNYCNNKEYENAYKLITTECKNKFFPTLEEFKLDVDTKFNRKKLYEYSNVINEGEMYVYELRLYDDVMIYGPTGSDEKIIYYLIINKINGEYKLSLNSYIKTDSTKYKFDQNDIQIEILKRDIYVDHIETNVQITNNTDNTLVYVSARVKYIFGNSNNKTEFTNINPNLEEAFLFVNENSTLNKTFTFKKSIENDYNHYMFSMGECYLINFAKTENKLEGKLNLDYLKQNCVNKFDIQIGL